MGVDYAHPSTPTHYSGGSEMKEYPVLSSIKLGTLHSVEQGTREPSRTHNEKREGERDYEVYGMVDWKCWVEGWQARWLGVCAE